ncbi:response regulator transcription factor [Bacillus fonticola]|uniref:response regulator transcription factor n=1 Tax=Bacillus fonticola TaxID=2728853 RepID=UPI001473A29F|nr:response regulator transcription factor [Bacillus fonticola]
MDKVKILVVDDEWNMRNLLRIHLVKSGFYVIEAENGGTALDKMNDQLFQLVILDLMMPGLDGIEVCQEIRKRDASVPILMLTAKTETRDKVKGLETGADDYLTKPFETEEFIARVQALLRRVQKTPAEETMDKKISLDGLTMDVSEHVVSVDEQPVHLTPKEYELLKMLLTHPKRVYSREQILFIVWGMDYFGDERTVDTHIKSIRRKLKRAGLPYNPIQTVWGVGYKIIGSSGHES